MAASQDTYAYDLLWGQTVALPNGNTRPIKSLSRTLNQLRNGHDPAVALEAQPFHGKSVTEVYFPKREAIAYEHKAKGCGWLCEGYPHPFYGPCCRFCKVKLSYPERHQHEFNIQTGFIHVKSKCAGLSPGDRLLLSQALKSVDKEHFRRDTQGRQKVQTSKSGSRTGRGVRTETEIDMEADEALERRLREESERQYRPTPFAPCQAIAPAHLVNDHVHPVPGSAASTPSRQRPATRAYPTTKRADEQHTTGATSQEPSSTGSAKKSSKKRKATVEPTLPDSIATTDEHQSSQKDEQDATKKKKKKNREPSVVEAKQKVNEDDDGPGSAPIKKSKVSKIKTPKAESSASPSLIDFDTVLKAAGIADTTELKLGLDPKLTARFVEYTSKTYPDVLGSHLQRFNFMCALEDFLKS